MTIHNGPGVRTLVLFKGCPLQCIWCSTPESQRAYREMAVFSDKCIHENRCESVCHLGAINLTEDDVSINRGLCDTCGKCAEICFSEAIQIVGRYMQVKALMEEIKKDIRIYKHSAGGVTFSGGEPLFFPDYLKAIARDCKNEDINVAVDTCGHVEWQNIETVLPYIDLFLWDIKHMDADTHKRLTGVTNSLILSNIQSVSNRGVPLYIRFPLIPGYTDSEENIRSLCEFVGRLQSVVEVDLLPVHHLGKARYKSLGRDYPLGDIELIPEEVLEEEKAVVESYGLRCKIVG